MTDRIVETYEECGGINHLGHSPLPSYREVVEILADLREILYPGYGRRQNLHMGNVGYHIGDLIDSLHDRLTQQITRALRHDCKARELETDFEAEAQLIAWDRVFAPAGVRQDSYSTFGDATTYRGTGGYLLRETNTGSVSVCGVAFNVVRRSAAVGE